MDLNEQLIIKVSKKGDDIMPINNPHKGMWTPQNEIHTYLYRYKKCIWWLCHIINHESDLIFQPQHEKNKIWQKIYMHKWKCKLITCLVWLVNPFSLSWQKITYKDISLVVWMLAFRAIYRKFFSLISS